MSSRIVGFRRAAGDHFEPNDPGDHKAQRHLRGSLEQIDYMAYAANREVLNAKLGETGPEAFQKVAVVAAQARARWAAAAISSTASGGIPSHEQIAELSRLRSAYEELTEAYDAMRRMVERGYLSYGPA